MLMTSSPLFLLMALSSLTAVLAQAAQTRGNNAAAIPCSSLPNTPF